MLYSIFGQRRCEKSVKRREKFLASLELSREEYLIESVPDVVFSGRTPSRIVREETVVTEEKG